VSLETELYSRLTGYSDLNAKVGSRVYPGYLTQNAALPALSYRRVSADREHAMGSDPEMAHVAMQVDVWARTYKEARETAEEVRRALQRWSTSTVQDTFIDNDTDLYEDENEIHHVAMDFTMHYEEPA
jgi:hypothetical protein